MDKAGNIVDAALMRDRVVVITGAARSRGIGLATATLLAKHGAKIAILDLDEAEARSAALHLGTGHIGIGCDVTDRDSCKQAIDAVSRQFERIDVLVNNAGMTQRRGVMEITDDDYELVTNTNLRGVLLMSQAAIPHLRANGGGNIVCISSMSAQQGGGVFGGGHYCAAKSGVLGLVRAMALEFGPENIRVNAIAPGLILTDFSRGATSDSSKQEKGKAFPLRRVGQPSDIAGACLYLASDLSSFVTGITLDVNGGALLRP